MNDEAVVYLRVSTDEQGRSGLGLEAQEAACRQSAERLGLQVTGVCVDAGCSGSVPVEKRPGLVEALGQLGRGTTLMVAKRDRLGRDPILVAMVERLLDRKKCRVVSAAGEGTESDEPTSVLMRRVVDAFAEYERLVIRARTKAALGAKRARGEKTGGRVPFGFEAVQGRLKPLQREQEVIDRMRSWQSEGLSVRRIAARLNEAGTPSKTGGRWSHTQVHRLLTRHAG